MTFLIGRSDAWTTYLTALRERNRNLPALKLDRMRSSEAYWQVGAVVNEIGQLVDQAWTLIKADAGRQALTVLEAITEEYMSEWENLDDSNN